MKNVLLISLTASIAVCTSASPLVAAVFRFKETATVSGAVVRMADVAHVAGADAEETRRIEQISLAPAPAPGRQLRLDLAAIRARLEAQGVSLSDAEFVGSSLITVTTVDHPREAQPFPRRISPAAAQLQVERAQEIVRNAVAEELTTRVPELAGATIDVDIAPEDAALLLVSASKPGAPIRLSGGSAPWDAPQCLAVHVQDSDGLEREIPVGVQISPRPNVVTVNATVPRGRVLGREDLSLRPANGSEIGIANLDQVIGKETTRPLRAGEPIGPGDVQPIPLVRAGDIVTVTSRRPGILVRRPMKAKSQGALNDSVVLVTLNGASQVTARVTGYHEAEILDTETAVSAQHAEGRIQFE